MKIPQVLEQSFTLKMGISPKKKKATLLEESFHFQSLLAGLEPRLGFPGLFDKREKYPIPRKAFFHEAVFYLFLFSC